MDTIKDLLLIHYPNHVGYTVGARVSYPCSIKTSDFSLGDSKACMKCAIVNNCNQIVMNIKTDAPVAVLEFHPSQVPFYPALELTSYSTNHKG